MTILMAEAVGTALLVLFGNGIVAGMSLHGSKAKDSGWVFLTFGWGFSLALAIYAVGKYSGAHLNPAFTLSMAVTGGVPWHSLPG